MSRQIIYNATTGETTIVEGVQEPEVDIETLKSTMQETLINIYKNVITSDFISTATGKEVVYSYSQQDQLNYSKWANVFALNPAKDSVIIGSSSDGVVQMTREQFIQFMADAENHEVGLYMKRKALEKRIEGASSPEELSTIAIEF